MAKATTNPLKVIQHTLADADISLSGSHVLAMCSGGIDSVALVYMLAGMHKGNRPRQVNVLFLDHSFRDDVSAEYEAAKKAAKECGFGFCYAKRPTEWGQDMPGGKQAVARAWRYETAMQVARDLSHDVIVTGHNGSDQLESAIMGLAAITSPGIARSMRTVRSLDKDLLLVRPMVGLSRAVIERYVQKSGITFAEDPTNADKDAYARNMIRHEIVPRLLAISPEAGSSLAKAAQREEEVQDMTTSMAAALLECWATEEGTALEIRDLKTISEAAQREVVAQWLRIYFPNRHKVNTKAIMAVQALIARGGAASLTFADGIQVHLKNDLLYITMVR